MDNKKNKGRVQLRRNITWYRNIGKEMDLSSPIVLTNATCRTIFIVSMQEDPEKDS